MARNPWMDHEGEIFQHMKLAIYINMEKLILASVCGSNIERIRTW
jgi:hypothetical protein